MKELCRIDKLYYIDRNLNNSRPLRLLRYLTNFFLVSKLNKASHTIP